MAIDYMNSKPYLAEKTFGWDRKTVALGLNELRTGLVCFDNFKARGNKKTEVKGVRPPFYDSLKKHMDIIPIF